MARLRVLTTFDPRQRGIPLDPRRLKAQVSDFGRRHPKLIQLGLLATTIVRSKDGAIWWAFCCPTRSADDSSQGVSHLEVFDLMQPQATPLGRTFFDLLHACAEIYCASWRQPRGGLVSQLEIARAGRQIERLIKKVDEFLASFTPPQLDPETLGNLEHVLLQAKRWLAAQHSQWNENSAQDTTRFEKALWCLHELLDRLGALLGVKPAA